MAGYAGIQNSDDTNNRHCEIFSIWDSRYGKPKATYVGEGAKSERFGGEGVGAKCMNTNPQWKPDYWHT